MNTRKNENGFSMVELAVSLMVIGLLIGGLLKGREIITNARATKTAAHLQAIDYAAGQFYSLYNAYPGDISLPTGVVPECTAPPCRDGGNGNNRLDSIGEQANFWRHLARAGLITDVNPSAAAINGPNTAIGGTISVLYNDQATWGGNASTWFGNSLGFADTRGKNIHLSLIDLKIDDGLPYRGMVRVEDTPSTGTSCVAASGEYRTDRSAMASCHFLMRLSVQ